MINALANALNEKLSHNMHTKFPCDVYKSADMYGHLNISNANTAIYVVYDLYYEMFTITAVQLDDCSAKCEAIACSRGENDVLDAVAGEIADMLNA